MSDPKANVGLLPQPQFGSQAMMATAETKEGGQAKARTGAKDPKAGAALNTGAARNASSKAKAVVTAMRACACAGRSWLCSSS